MIAERVVEFGPGRKWIGVLSQPSGEVPAGSKRVALLLTNSGIIHRVGPNRLHVRLARLAAAAGMPAFRYDLPGIGDSDAAAGTSGVGRSNVTATMAAMSALERAGVAKRFVIFGICSGADHAFESAFTDPRVVGAVMVDSTRVFSTTRHRLLAFAARLRRVLRPRSLGRLVDGGVARARAGLRHDAPEPGRPVLLDPKRHPDEWRAANHALTTLVDRGTQLLFVMTRHNRHVYSYDAQMRDGFPRIEGLDRILACVRYQDAEHTFTREAHRTRLEKELLGWLGRTEAAGRAR